MAIAGGLIETLGRSGSNRLRVMRALRAGLASAAAVVLVAGLSLATPAPALGSDGFTEKATTTYVVNAERERLDVTIDLTFKNTTRSTATTIYYYDGDAVWLEKDARNVRATSPGATVTVTKLKTSGQYAQYRFRWSPVLLYGKSRTVHITYQIPSGAPRSASWFRISPAYVDFCVIGTGLDGGSTMIKVPLSYSMTVGSQENGRLGSRIEGDTRIYTTGTLDEAYKFWACLTGERPDQFTSTTLAAPSGREIRIQAWPDDSSWATEISAQLDEVLLELEELIGLGLPGDGPIAIREVGQGTLGQYAGFFDPSTGTARIGEDLEANGLIVHELAHAWFNGGLFQPLWLSEGYAEWARSTIERDTCPAPASYPDEGRPNLEAWRFAGPRATDVDLAVIDYQYAASCALITQVAAKLGEDGMRAVLAAITNHELAYQSGSIVRTGPKAAVAWQTWLDVVDEIGLAERNGPDGAETIADLLVPYGITGNGSGATLQERAAARDGYHRLKAAFGDWVVPPVILQPMSNWHFDKASAAMATATQVREAAARLATVLPGVDGLTGKARALLEAATKQEELDAALVAANDRLDAAAAVAAASAAMAAPQELVMQVGMMGTDLQPALDAAIQAIRDDDPAAAHSGAAAIQAALADAPGRGQARLLLGIGIPVLLLLLMLGFFLIRRRRRRAAVAGASAMAELAMRDAALATPAGIDAPAVEPPTAAPPATDEPSAGPPPAP